MINLYTNIYQDPSPLRQKEIDFCLEHNMRNKNLNFIPIESDHKLKYNDFFDVINRITGPEDINIIANTDIYFDDTILLAEKLPHRTCFALSRYDVRANGDAQFFNYADSQDSWFVRGPVRGVDGSFCLGTAGCDNSIANRFHVAGYRVINPSRSIKTYHLHISNIRRYTHSAAHSTPQPYMTVEPSSL